MAGITERIPLHSDVYPESGYKGPAMGYLISHNLLGYQIITSYDDKATDGEILDGEELARLRSVNQRPIRLPYQRVPGAPLTDIRFTTQTTELG